MMPRQALDNILLVDDEYYFCASMKSFLESKLFVQVAVEKRGDMVMGRVREENPDLIILDLGLPGRDGMSILPELRMTYQGPILAITGRVLDRSQAAILKAGADFFLAKPFHPRELAAVVASMLRMVYRIQNTSLATGGPAALITSSSHCTRLNVEIGPIFLDGIRHRATLDGRDLLLTEDEFALLWLLGSHAGQPVTREEISCYTRDRDHEPSSRAVDMLVSRLRHKLGDCQTPNRWILTVRNQGYQLKER